MGQNQTIYVRKEKIDLAHSKPRKTKQNLAQVQVLQANSGSMYQISICDQSIHTDKSIWEPSKQIIDLPPENEKPNLFRVSKNHINYLSEMKLKIFKKFLR